ncbi:MAG: epoxyqueuosine reductase [Chloroflexota bacterium]|nr:epoxyqueuosine reductase [Chloroflexota bacterium]
MHDDRDNLTELAKDMGADIIGFADPEMWNVYDEVPHEFRPSSIWPEVNTVIVLGIGMLLPIVEMTPSILHTEMYRTCNGELDSLAFNLARYLNRQQHASIFFPRDAYGDINILIQNPYAAFSHVMAAKYAGLGTIGLSHNLLTPSFGPRVRFVSVFTSLKLAPDSVLNKELCTRCLACVKCCPVKAISSQEDTIIGKLDSIACAKYHSELNKKRSYPCGICTKVCPIGADRKLYNSKHSLQKYQNEAEALAADPEHPDYKSWIHVRRYGRWP